MVGSFCLRIVLAAACIFLIAACVSPSANGASGAAEPVSDVAAVFGSTSADATAAAVPDAVSIDAAAATAAATAPAAAAIVPDAVSTDSTSADATAATTAPAAVAIVPGTISIAVEQTDSADQQYIQRVYSETVHYNEEIYAIARTKGAAYEAVRDVRAGVVPHHALASRLIASFFETASSQSFDTIVILGPNHFAKIAAIVTTGADWYTPFGALRNDDELTELLLSSDILHAVRDDGIVENDHAASYLIPFVADYFPAAQVTAALLSPQMSVGQIGELARLLSEYRKGKHILLIGSIDFSHYLLPSQAKANDEATKYTVRENNVDDLYRMSDGFLDSPSTLLTVLRYVELIGGSGLALLAQSSSYEELGLPPECVSPGDGVTTYLIYGDY
ncbi:MAG: AmmeMemoRadiSam system protein B [Peptococcaceae bacterium]|nr:AmmeMemoRadiSam system protein B [Peptococcaceae bacterium]